jgi:hypothetical protein
VLGLWFAGGAAAWAQLTAEQKLFDFQQMASMYAKNYAPLEWKRQINGLDLYELSAWANRVRASKSDVEFADILFEFAARLDDGHTQTLLPAAFVATLPMATDLYEGRILIEGIDRRALPAARFPFVAGDEVVAVDGVTAEQWLEQMSRYGFGGNPRTNRRIAADYVGYRAQSVFPFAARIGETAKITVKRDNGAAEDYEIPWTKRGVALENFGKVPSPRFAAAKESDTDTDDFLKRLRNLRVPANRPMALHGFGDPVPYYRLPSNFRVRLGRSPEDAFVSGIYEASGLRIGYLRLGSFDSSSAALTQFIDEVAFFRANTDGLVIDDTRNPGGDACYTETLVRLLMPRPFQTLGFQVRPSAALVARFSRAVENAKASRAEQYQIALLEAQFEAVLTAYKENRGVTGPIPLCSPSLDVEPVRDRTGAAFAYGGPIVVLVDELSASAADAFAAMLQDNDRAVIFGMRTMGLGGALFDLDLSLTTYSEIQGSITGALMVRPRDVVTSEYPTARFIENIGVRPDIYYDYMTPANLTGAGVPFVQAFTEAIVNTIRGR